MFLFHILLASFLLPLISPTLPNVRNSNSTKTKRTLSDQVYANGDNKAVVFYMDNPQTSDISELQAAASSPGIRNFYSSPSKPLALVTVQQPIQVFEQDNPKQVAAQQVLYEFQQTPTNAESNVHVKQLFQPNIDFTTRAPLHTNQQLEQLPTAQPLSSIHTSAPVTTNQHFSSLQQPQAVGIISGSSYHPATSETVVSPVQHNLYTNHGLNSASFSYYNPLLPPSQQYQNTQITPKQTPGKYIYLNGKIVYHPNHAGQGHTFPQNNFHNKAIYHNHQKLPLINYGVRHNRPNTPQSILHGNPAGRPQNKLVPTSLPPITNNRFQAPKQLQQIDRPSTFPQKQDEINEEERKLVNEKKNEDGESEEEEEEKEDDYDENDFEDDNDQYTYESFPFEDEEYLDEEESHQFKSPKLRKNKEKSRYSDKENEDARDDDQFDAHRGASKQNNKHHIPNRTGKYRVPPKYDSSENYAYREKYSSSMKHQSPSYKNNGNKEKPQGQFKKTQYSKKPGGKPKIKTIEGKFSEHVPITHKHKVHKERWFVSKDA